MNNSLKAGISYQHTMLLKEDKMVPALYPEASEFQQMPQVFATGFMVGFLEWACLTAVLPYLDWPNEQTVGTHINVSHLAASPSGLTVVAAVKLVEVDGRRLKFDVEAHDGIELISSGTHERFIINRRKFDKKVETKRIGLNS